MVLWESRCEKNCLGSMPTSVEATGEEIERTLAQFEAKLQSGECTIDRG